MRICVCSGTRRLAVGGASMRYWPFVIELGSNTRKCRAESQRNQATRRHRRACLRSQSSAVHPRYDKRQSFAVRHRQPRPASCRNQSNVSPSPRLRQDGHSAKRFRRRFRERRQRIEAIQSLEFFRHAQTQYLAPARCLDCVPIRTRRHHHTPGPRCCLAAAFNSAPSWIITSP